MTGQPMIAIRYPHLIADYDRHGSRRLYVRRKGLPKVRIRSEPGTSDFEAEYRAALAIAAPAHNRALSSPREGTWRWLVAKYLESGEYKGLHPSTQRVRLRVLQDTWREPRAPGAAELFADIPLSRMNEHAIAVLRDRKSETPQSANNRLKAIRRVFAWAREARLVHRDLARDVRFIRAGTQGHHSWTHEEIEQFQRRHPLGSKPHLALMLMLLTGVRKSDAVRLGRQHERGGKLVFTAAKNEHRKPVRIEIPILPELQAVLDASPTGSMCYLETAYQKPFTPAGFGVRFRRWCDQAGLPHCSAHGLRKAGAATAAEGGASEAQLMAIFGWTTTKEPERYTRAANRAKMARDAMRLLVKK